MQIYGEHGLLAHPGHTMCVFDCRGVFHFSPQWTEGLVIKLREATHGQWLYQCVQIHDKITGTRVTARKEEIQQEIERQLELGTEDLLDEDQYLGEIKLDDLENSSGERQEYWLLTICSAREACLLRRQQTSNTCR